MMGFHFSKENLKVVIFGCGRLGANLADYLYNDGKSVVIVDSNDDSFRKLSHSYGGLTLLGDGTELETFQDLEIDDKTIVIAVTDDDNTNIMISQIAREIYHVKTIISRLYDPERQCVYDEFHIDTICPTYLSVHCIEDILKNKGVELA